MFGIIRPCRNRLDDELRAAWMAHLCGMCLALRDEHGQLARVVTNYDAVVVSALVEAQAGTDGRRRRAGPCPLRGLRTASVAAGGGAQLAASVSLLLASAKLRDHLDDGDIDGALRVRATRTVAARWAAAGTETGSAIALDTGVLLAAVAQQAALERAPGSILDVTGPAETATALAFRHTAVVAGRPENGDALAEAGRLFGRLAHLLDAVEDRHADSVSGTWNPILALGLRPDEVRRHCDDAVLGIKLALRDASFADPRLVHILLVHELETAVERTFTGAGHPGPDRHASCHTPSATQPPLTPPLQPIQQPPGAPPGWGEGTGVEAPAENTTKRKGIFAGCAAWLVICGTCQVCCADEWTNPCTGQKHEGCVQKCCDCSNCGDCCTCGDCDGWCCDGCDCCDC